MLRVSLSILICFVVFTISGNFALADCLSIDLATDPCIPDEAWYRSQAFNVGEYS